MNENKKWFKKEIRTAYKDLKKSVNNQDSANIIHTRAVWLKASIDALIISMGFPVNNSNAFILRQPVVIQEEPEKKIV